MSGVLPVDMGSDNTIIEQVYNMVTSGECKKLKDALKSTNYELGTIIPIGYGLNITIEPNSTILKLGDTFETKKVLNVLFKYCGALHINIEFSCIATMGAILYSNEKIGHLMFIQNSDKVDFVKSKMSNSVLKVYGIKVYGFKDLTKFFNEYYYTNILTNFK